MRRATVLLAVTALTASCLPRPEARRDGGSPRARLSRVALCDALSEWSSQTGRSHCYSARLPEIEIVVARPGDRFELEPVLARAGWEMLAAGEVTVISRRGDEAAAAKLAETLLDSPDEAERRAAAHGLGRLTVPAAIPPLVAGLADKSDGVRFQCLEALCALEGDFEVRRLPGRVSLMKVARFDPAPLAALATGASDDRARRAWRYSVALLGRAGAEAVRPLARSGLIDLEPRVRLIGAEAMAQTATAEDEPALVAFLSSTRDWAARGAALRALVRLPGLGRELNVAALAAGPDDELARLACEELGLSGREEAIEPLARAFAAGGPERAALAAEALGRLDRPRADVVLLSALRAPEPWRRAAAAAGLAARGRRLHLELAGPLAEAVAGSPESAAAVARALPEAAGPAALHPLLKLSRESEPHVRLAAARALRRLGGPEALARLNELSADPDREVRVEAQAGLGWLGDLAEAEKLAALAREAPADRDAAEGALVGLGHLRSPAARGVAVATLLDLMKDPPKCPFAAGRAAAMLADERLTPGLLEVMARSQPGKTKGAPRSGAKLSVDCMDALGRIATREAAGALARDWWEWENMTRYEVGRALRENLDRGEVFETILRLTESSGHTLTAAAFSLADSRDPRAVAALVRMLAERHEPIAAATALGMIADPAATDALLAAARDENHPGRFAAGRALRMRDLAWQPRVREALVELYGWRADGTPPPIEEQPAGTWMLRRWARDYDDHSMSSLTYESAAAYDPLRGRVMQWGAHGRRYDSPQTGETWAYDPPANSWAELGARELPPGTCMTRKICFDSRSDRLVVRGASGGGHGWLFTREQALRQSSPWTYDPAADRWIPMRAPTPPGFGISHLVAFDRRHGVVLGLARKGGGVWAYETGANRWTEAPTGEGARPEKLQTVAYDARRGRMLFAGQSGLWSYSLDEGTWTDLKPSGTTPDKGCEPLVYDAANDAALLFAPGHGGAAVHAYDPEKNAWSPAESQGMRPDYTNWDAVFDERSNVVVVCGGEVADSPGSPTARETWTYRYGPGSGAPRPPLPPGPAGATAARDGVLVEWRAPSIGRVGGYLVSRADAEATWGVRFEPLNDGKPVTETRFLDRSPLAAGKVATYLIRSVSADGRTSVDPAVAVTRPPIPLGLVAIHGADRRARLTWEGSQAADVVGHNVYRAAVTAGPFDGGKPVDGLGDFEKLTAEPVRATEFTDPEPAGVGTGGWVLAPRAYLVKAVSSLGIESGPSAWVLTVPDCPKRIEARRRSDGSAVVRWERNPRPEVVGYHVYRMDNWRLESPVRLTEAPIAGTEFVDPDGRPTGERQRYWVTAVDGFGQEGPSGTGAWSFHRS